MVWVRERTISSERPPLVGEVIANFLRIEGATWPAWRIPTAVLSVFYTGATTFLSSSSSVVLTRLSGLRSRPTTYFLFWWCRESNPGLRICSQELWQLDHRGGAGVKKHFKTPHMSVLTLAIGMCCAWFILTVHRRDQGTLWSPRGGLVGKPTMSQG
jgi:hypothetical protein